MPTVALAERTRQLIVLARRGGVQPLLELVDDQQDFFAEGALTFSEGGEDFGQSFQMSHRRTVSAKTRQQS